LPRRTGDDYDLASETDGSDTEGDTSIESDMESDMSDMSDDVRFGPTSTIEAY
jgi:hypothetical protein